MSASSRPTAGWFRSLAAKGVASISGNQLLAALSTASSDAGIEQAARRIVSAQHRYLAASAAIAIAATGLAILVVRNHQLIFHTAPDWIVPIALLLAGLLFFWWRERDHLSYGLFEVMVGLLISSQSIVTLPAPYELSTAKSIQLVGGLYVMVRGFDNVDRSVEDTRLGGWWKRLFRRRMMEKRPADRPRFLSSASAAPGCRACASRAASATAPAGRRSCTR